MKLGKKRRRFRLVKGGRVNTPKPWRENPKAWQRLRLRVFDRAGWQCERCERPARLECDHVTPRHLAPGRAWGVR